MLEPMDLSGITNWLSFTGSRRRLKLFLALIILVVTPVVTPVELVVFDNILDEVSIVPYLVESCCTRSKPLTATSFFKLETIHR